MLPQSELPDNEQLLDLLVKILEGVDYVYIPNTDLTDVSRVVGEPTIGLSYKGKEYFLELQEA